MARVLVLGVYYPPANFIAGRRLEGWARHLPSFGHEPRVLTRYYDPEERNGHDFYASSRTARTLGEPWVEEGRAVYTGFRQSLWERLPVPGPARGFAHFAWPDPYHSVWLGRCRSYLRASDFRPDVVIGSSGPPGVLRVARKIAEDLGVPWIADFRDLWIEQFDRTADTRLKYFFQRRHLRGAAGVTVVCEAIADELRRQLAPLEKPIRVIYNGAEPAPAPRPAPEDAAAVALFHGLRREGRRVLTYMGTLYPAQEVRAFLDAVAEFNRAEGERGGCAVVLGGRHDPAEYARWPFVRVVGRVAHETALFMQRESAALFYPTWPGRYSGFSGKIFEQALTGRPVLVGFNPSHDLVALAGRLPPVVIVREREQLIGELGRLPPAPGEAGDGGTQAPEFATKKYWAGELARFIEEVLGRRGASGVTTT
jgi:glycosyltransferase involved in cell wall biosynthesis